MDPPAFERRTAEAGGHRNNSRCRISAGRVGYCIISLLATISLLLNYLLLGKLIAQDDGSISYNDMWRNAITNNFNPTPASSSAPLLSDNNRQQPPPPPEQHLSKWSIPQQLQYPPWSACLLVKDNNIILPEWLAYHYTVLPLRRLIVAVDPSSKTDPKYIFDQYKSIGMNITVWTEDDYWVDGAREHEQRNYRVTNETLPAYKQDRLVYRQKTFYHGCLEQLKREKQTWTVVIDADEYIAFNYLDERSSEGVPSWCYMKRDPNDPPLEDRSQCEKECSALNNFTCDMIRDEEKGRLGYCRNTTCATPYLRESFRTQLNQSATAAEHIHTHIDRLFDMYGCIVLTRYLFSSRESQQKVIETDDVNEAFNTTLFHTLRYHYRTELDNPQPGKSIIDVSRFGGQPILSPHRLNRKCISEARAYPDNFKLSFRVHHYVGSWESFRLRGVELFKQRNYQERWVVDDTTPQYTAKEGTRTWLSQFATLVGGKEKALELTEKIRLREEREVEQYLIESST